MIRTLFSRTVLGIFLVSLFVMQLSVFALSVVPEVSAVDAAPAITGSVNGASTTKTVGLTNPLKVRNLQCLVVLILRLAVNIGAFAAVIYILWAGFLFVTAQGDPGKVKAAKSTLFNAVIGTALIMGAWVFAQIIARTIGTVTGTPIGLMNQNQC